MVEQEVKYRTAESVTPSHPDKMCDRISDAILDAALKVDPNARVAIETMGGHGVVTITGELTLDGYIPMRDIAKRIVKDSTGVQVNVVEQSMEIAYKVNTGGAGDQGIMIGYACRENDAMIPNEAYLARELCRYIYNQRPFDGKTQITLKDGILDTIVASFQNVPQFLLETYINKWLKDFLGIADHHGTIKILANPAGDWVVGGFDADTGLTGRKLMVDNYGPRVPIGGGCFSGKDPSKVDRSAAYMARRIAVDILNGYTSDHEVFVQLAYAIGIADPIEAVAWTKAKDGSMGKVVYNLLEMNKWKLTPNGIIKALDLKKPIYEKTAEFGHFGNNFNWDK